MGNPRNLRGVPTEKLKQLRLNRKDFKKGGDGLRGKNVTEQFRVKEKDVKRTMKWRTPEISLKKLSKPPDATSQKPDKSIKKFERPRRPISGYTNTEHDTPDGSSEGILSNEEEENEVYRKISERRSELNRARRNTDECHVSWYSATGQELPGNGHENSLSSRGGFLPVSSSRSSANRVDHNQQNNDENAILLLNHDQLVAVCNGKGSSIERARTKRSSKVWSSLKSYEVFSFYYYWQNMEKNVNKQLISYFWMNKLNQWF